MPPNRSPSGNGKILSGWCRVVHPMGVGPIAILAVTLLAWNAFYFYLSTTFSVASLAITSTTGARFGPPDPTNVINVGGDGAGRGLDPTIGAVHGGVDRGFVDRELAFLEFAWKYPTHPVDPRRKSVDIDHKDAYSGSWWQSTSAFVSTQSFEGDESLTPSQEDATFEAFQASGMNVSATRDWLDLSVDPSWGGYQISSNDTSILRTEGISFTPSRRCRHSLGG